MLQRVTNETMQRSTLRNFQTNLSAMATLQAQLSSGKKIQVPSDDPSATGQDLALRATQSQLGQYTRNAQDGDSWLTMVDTALTSSLGYLRNARDLVVQSGDAGLGQDSRDALADNIDALKEALLQQANTRYQGRTVFAGTSDAGAAFTEDDSGATPAYTWTGVPGATVDRRIGAESTVRVDTDGSQAFGLQQTTTNPDGTTTTTQSTVFALLDQISAGLRAGHAVTSSLNDIDASMQNLLTAASSNGGRQKVVENTLSEISSQTLTVQGQRSNVEDIDLASTIMNLQMQQVTYQASLSAGSHVLQPSLLEFLQ
ncbi:MAG TPA: flagellar hook-associated protein FlgL [Cellulomonas sp.]